MRTRATLPIFNVSAVLYTVDELASYLARSDVPTVIVEGDDDVRYLTIIERKLRGLSVLQAGGKDSVLSLLSRRNEFACPCAFIVDRDDWAGTQIPDEMTVEQALIITDGYSVENDLLRDIQYREFLLPGEELRFDEAVAALKPVLASCLARPRHLRYKFGKRLSEYFDYNSNVPKPEALQYANENPPEKPVLERLQSDLDRYARGKTLVQLLNRIFQAPGRHVCPDIRHSFDSAWSREEGNAVTILHKLRAYFEGTSAGV